MEASDAPPPPQRRQRRCINRACMVGAAGNFSIQYNISVLSVAVAVMTSYADVATDDASGDFPEPGWAQHALLGAIFAGMLTGLVVMGFVADALGRRTGLLMTLSLVVVGVLATALASWGSVNTVYAVIAVARFVVGFGVGGIYPTAFATVAEAHHSDDDATAGAKHTDASQAVGWAYLWQMPGAMAPYALAWALLSMPASTPALTSIQFRLLIAVGVLPAAVVVWEAWRTGDDAHTAAKGAAAPAPRRSTRHPSPLAVLRANPQYLRRLLGTAGCWFLYDAGYYGTAIETPAILKDIFASSDTLADICWQSLVIASFGIPGTLLAIWPMRHYGARWLNIVGFVVLAAAFASLAIVYYASATGLTTLKFVMFCAISLALSWGPSVGVHVCATMLYPTELRGTFIGLSAAGGKLGAVVGTFMFTPIANAWGLPAVMWVQVALSLLGVVLSLACLPSDAPGVHLDIVLPPAGAARAAGSGVGAPLLAADGGGDTDTDGVSIASDKL